LALLNQEQVALQVVEDNDAVEEVVVVLRHVVADT
jgi:hypothetical protein